MFAAAAADISFVGQVSHVQSNSMESPKVDSIISSSSNNNQDGPATTTTTTTGGGGGEQKSVLSTSLQQILK